jgi:hypothetical protein
MRGREVEKISNIFSFTDRAMLFDHSLLKE